MQRDRRAFLLMTGEATITGPYLAKGQTAEKLVVPHGEWDCGMPDGIPNPESGVLSSRFR